MFLEKKSLKSINVFLMLLIAFFIPINKTIVPILIGLLLIISFFKSDFKTSLKAIYSRNISTLMIFFYLITVLSLFWTDSENIKIAMFDFEVKFSIFVVPIIFLNHGILEKKQFNNIIFSFVVGSFISSFICLIIALMKTFITGQIHFFYNLYSFYLHPSYFAMYIIFAIAGCVYLFKAEYFLSKKIFLIIMIYYLIIIFLLSSKAGFITILIVIPFLFFKLIDRFKFAIVTSLVAITVLSYVFVEYNFRAYSFYQLSESKIINNSDEFDSAESSTMDRLNIYFISLKLIKGSPFIGYGAGDIKPILFKEYEKNNLKHALETKLNVHNQFLETAIGQGIAGLLLLLLLLLFPVFYLKNNKNYLLLIFIIITSINYLFESMLNTQAGVVFFAFFYVLLNFVKTENNDKIFAT